MSRAGVTGDTEGRMCEVGLPPPSLPALLAYGSMGDLNARRGLPVVKKFQPGTFALIFAGAKNEWETSPQPSLSLPADLTRSRAAPPARRGSAPPPRRTEARAQRTLERTLESTLWQHPGLGTGPGDATRRGCFSAFPLLILAPAARPHVAIRFL